MFSDLRIIIPAYRFLAVAMAKFVVQISVLYQRENDTAVLRYGLSNRVMELFGCGRSTIMRHCSDSCRSARDYLDGIEAGLCEINYRVDTSNVKWTKLTRTTWTDGVFYTFSV